MMPRFSILPTDTVTVCDGFTETTENAIERLREAAVMAGHEGANLRQNRQPGFSHIWRVTLPNDRAKMLFKLAGGDHLEERFGV